MFALPRFGTSVVLGIEGFALFTLYSLAYGLPPFLTTVAQAMGYLSIAASQFVLGWVSDKTRTRLGRRKPYMLLLAPVLAVSFIFMLLPGLVLPDLTDTAALFWWLLAWDVIFRASYGVTTPYQAWMAEQFTAGDRPRVSQLQNTFNFIGNGLMALLTMLVFTGVFTKIQADVNAIPMEFLAIVVAFGAVVVVLFYMVALLLPTEPATEIRSNLMESLKVTVRNRNFMLVVLMQGIAGLAWSITSSVMLTYTEVVLALGTMEYLVVSVALLLGIFTFLFVWRRMMEKAGKKTVLLRIFLAGALFLPVTLLGLVPMESRLWFGVVFIAGIAAVLGGWYLFPYIMYADIAEDEEKNESGELRAGIYAGFPSIILNLFQAAGIILLGAIASLPDISVGSLTFSAGYVAWGPLCAVILLGSYAFTRKFVRLDFQLGNGQPARG